MKILIDARTLGKRPSGVGMYLYNFICGLMRYDTVQIELLTDVVESAPMQELKQAHIPIHRYGTHIEKSIGVYAYFRFVQKKINEVRPDIFWEGNNLIPVVLRNPYGRIIVTVHDVFPITAPDGYGRIYPLYFRWNLRKTLRHVDAVIYDAKDARESVEHYYPAAKKLPSHVSYIITEKMPELPVTEGDYFLYIGNLEKRKGTDLLLKAYVKYREAGGEKKLYLAGKIRSDEIEALLKLCQEKVEGISYRGYLDREEKYRMYAGCSAFLFPSRGEGFGMPVIEALRYGKKVLVSDLKIFEEIAGDALFYYHQASDEEEAVENLTQSMQKLMCDTEDACMAERRCREAAARYEEGPLADALKGFFERLLENA